MNFVHTKIQGVIIIEPIIFNDERGYFLESFNQQEFEKNIQNINFIKDNESKSKRGVIRGLHFQRPPFDQSKLVRCVKGCIIDVVVDIRKNSPTYGKHLAVELSEKNKRQLFISKGFAHGFSVLSKEAIFTYKVDNFYRADYEGGIIWNDKDINIDWKIPFNEQYLSKKDKSLLTFKELKSPFTY